MMIITADIAPADVAPLARIARVLGCPADLAARVLELAKLDPTWERPWDDRSFEALCWACFRGVRGDMLDAGLGDPIWSLTVRD